MKLKLKPTSKTDFFTVGYSTVTVKHPSDDLTVEQIFEDVVIPVLLAWGFSQTTIDNYMDSGKGTP
jgi:hypothetical protein